jgi:putative phosphonate transport system ATP-binding protein
MRTDWGFVHQNPIDGLRMTVSAGANVGERLMAVGTGITAISAKPRPTGSAGSKSMKTGSTTSRAPFRAACASGCRSRAISSPGRGSSSWTSRPAVSMSRCRRGCSTCLRGLVSDLGLAVVVVTHDLAVARLLSDRMIVMKDGRVIETGLTDRVLDDPRAPYTQLLVSSILQV